jgi:hypothetical protein
LPVHVPTVTSSQVAKGAEMRFWLMVAASCLAGPAFAGDGIMILGAGQRSCGQFLAGWLRFWVNQIR